MENYSKTSFREGSWCIGTERYCIETVTRQQTIGRDKRCEAGDGAVGEECVAHMHQRPRRLKSKFEFRKTSDEQNEY